MHTLGNLLVLTNPTAGRGRARLVGRSLEEYWRAHGVSAQFRSPGSVAELRQLVREAPRGGFSTVVALGGDGTFHEVMNAAHGLGVLVGLVPAGGGNDLARALGLPADPLEAAHALLAGRTRRIDLLRLTNAAERTCLYAGAGGAGIDAEAARLANTRFHRVPGAARYVAAAVAAFREARPLEVKVIADGASREFTAHLVAVANTPSYGGGIHIAPDARIDDGWMDLAIVAPLRWTQLLDGLLLALRTGDIRWPEMQRMRARKLRLETDRPAMFHGDGEVLGDTPVEIEVLPGELEVLAPQ